MWGLLVSDLCVHPPQGEPARPGPRPDPVLFRQAHREEDHLGRRPGARRFRSFLRADCAFFLSHSREHDHALKRGGSVRLLSIDSGDAETRFGREPAHDETPERLFERDWAVSLIDRVLGRIERHYQSRGRGETFRRLKPILTAEPDAARFARLAAELKTTEGALRTAVHRLRARVGEELRAEIAETLDDPTPEAIAEELRGLFSALGS